MNNLTPENFRSIAAACVDACKTNSKGKATQEIILTVLRKKAGFQSNQSLDNYVKEFKSKQPEIPIFINDRAVPTESDGRVKNPVLEIIKNNELSYRNFQSDLTNEDGEYHENNSFMSNFAFSKLIDLENSGFEFSMENNNEEEAIAINGKHHGIYILSNIYSKKAMENISNKYEVKHINGIGNSNYYVCLKFNNEVWAHTFDAPHIVETSLRGFSNFEDAVLYSRILLEYLDKPYDYLMSDLLSGKLDPPKPQITRKEEWTLERFNKSMLDENNVLHELCSDGIKNAFEKLMDSGLYNKSYCLAGDEHEEGIYIRGDNHAIYLLSKETSPSAIKNISDLVPIDVNSINPINKNIENYIVYLSMDKNFEEFAFNSALVYARTLLEYLDKPYDYSLSDLLGGFQKSN